VLDSDAQAEFDEMVLKATASIQAWEVVRPDVATMSGKTVA